MSLVRKLQISRGLLFALCFLTYWGALTPEFFWDDAAVVEAGQTLSSAAAAFDPGSLGLSEGGTRINFWRPLATLTYYLEAQLFGVGALSGHITNVLLHCCNALLAFSWLRRRLAVYLPEDELWVPFLGALFWAAVPIKSEAVGWISARPDVMGGLAVLLGAELIARAERPRTKYTWAALFTALGVLCKEPMVAAPLVFLIEVHPSFEPKKVFRSPLTYIGGGLVGAYLTFRFVFLGIGGQFSEFLLEIGILDRVALFFESITYAARSLLFPFYSVILSGPIAFASEHHIRVEPLMGGPGLVIFLLIILVWIRLKQARPFLVMLLAPLLPVLNLVPTGLESRMCDRYLYLPSLGMVGGALAICCHYTKRNSPWLRGILVGLCIAAVATGARRAWLFGHPDHLLAWEMEHGSRPRSLVTTAVHAARARNDLVAARDLSMMVATRIADFGVNGSEQWVFLAARQQYELTGEQLREVYFGFDELVECLLHGEDRTGDPVIKLPFHPGEGGLAVPCASARLQRYARAQRFDILAAELVLRARRGENVLAEVRQLASKCQACPDVQLDLALAALALGEPSEALSLLPDAEMPAAHRLQRTAQHQEAILKLPESPESRAAVFFQGLAPFPACRLLERDSVRQGESAELAEFRRVVCTLAGRSIGEPRFLAGSSAAVELRTKEDARYQLVRRVFPELRPPGASEQGPKGSGR